MTDALFRPGELESPGRHVVARDLRGLKGLFRANRAQILWARDELELPAPAAKYLSLLVALPRSKESPLGVGLQASNADKAKVLNVCPRTVHYARARLRKLGLITTYQRQRSVKAITAARKPEHRRDSFTSWTAAGVAIEHSKADCYAIDYPTPHALAVLRAHELGRVGVALGRLWKTLWEWLQFRCERFTQIAKRQRGNCTPNNVGECEGGGSRAASLPAANMASNEARDARARGFAARTGDPPRADFQPSSAGPPCGKAGSRTRYADGRSRKSRPLPASGSYGGWSLPPPSDLRARMAFHERRMRSGQLIPGEYERHKEAHAELRRELWRRKAARKRLRKAEA